MTPPPPPSPALLDAVARMGPVRTRSPGRTLAWVLGVWTLYGALPLVAFRLRPDLPFLPAAWLVAVGGAWLVAFVATLGLALLPRSGQVLPDGARAVIAAAGGVAALVAVSALFPAEAPGHSLRLPLAIGVRNCTTFAVVFSILPVAVGVLACRRVVTVGSWRVGAALGAASGALAGLVLHLLCPVAGAAHVTFAHAGAVLVCAALGALLVPLVLERQSANRGAAI